MENRDIPYIVYESAAARFERIIKRLWILVIILATMLVGTNVAWIHYEAQFQTVETTQTVTQDTAEGGSNNFVGGDYGTTDD